MKDSKSVPSPSKESGGEPELQVLPCIKWSLGEDHPPHEFLTTQDFYAQCPGWREDEYELQ